MKKKKIEKIIIELEKKIEKYSFYYFNLNKSIIDDEKYDFLIKKLKYLKKKYLIKTNNIININKTKLNKYTPKKKHNIPMLSIDNIYHIDEFKKYIYKYKKKINKKNIEFCCELKIDGLAISLIYKNNKLIRGLTKGNYIYGENVTDNIKKIENIPKILKTKKNINYLEVRGEIFISKKIFSTINKKNYFSNPRNLVSGTIRQSNSKKIKERNLLFIGYDLIKNKKNRIFISKQNKCLEKIKKLGFSIEKNTKICNSIKEINYFYNKIINKNFDYEIDGIVIKINDRKFQELIGYNSKYIKWCIALKFPSKIKKTKIKNIIFKTGKTGIITPIAEINPIEFEGVNIKKVNLYNLKYLSKLNLSLKDEVFVERRGNVIPKIIKIEKKNNNNIILPDKCPSCNKKILFNKKIPKCYSNLECPDQLKNVIKNLSSKNGFNIKGLGKNIIYKLIKKKYITSIESIFNLNYKNLIKIYNIKKKIAKKILLSINKSKNINLKNFIFSLSIPGIGIFTSNCLSIYFKYINNFLNSNIDNLKKIKNIGIKKAIIINNYLNNKINIKNIKKILKKIKIN